MSQDNEKVVAAVKQLVEAAAKLTTAVRHIDDKARAAGASRKQPGKPSADAAASR